MEQKKTPEEIRADARQRKRNQRARDYALLDELRVESLDPADRRIREIMAQTALEGRKPRPAIVSYGPPTPARLPSLSEWRNCLKSIPTEAAQEELIRVEAAIAAGLTEFPTVRDRNETTNV